MKNLAFILLLAAVVFGPILLRPGKPGPGRTDDVLTIISPHNEAIRHEFERAFSEHHLRVTGRQARIDWRTPGGTSEISRYLESEYVAAFQNHWQGEWSTAVQAAFQNPKIELDDTPADDTVAQAARRAFLESNVGCGLDLFFGGGSFDFKLQADAGRLVPSGVIEAHPELFNEETIPQTVGGEPFWDPQGRWVGACLSAFGICYNTDVLARLNIERPPAQWADLADPSLNGSVALADPTQSGSVAKAFEMLIQQQMLIASTEISEAAGGGEKQAAVEIGWPRAMQMIQRIAGNARYFTDSASKVPWDVESGDAAAGMCIDFYGRFQSEAVRRADGTSRLQYVTPAGGSSVGVDPIGLLRGAPRPELARAFIEFVLSPDGQKLWNWKTGAPGGPHKYALRRLPIRPELYAAEFAQFRSDPEVMPYEQARGFTYHEEWTAPLFRAISLIIRTMCIDSHDELREAWSALIAADYPPEAMAAFSDVSRVSHSEAWEIRTTMRSANKLEEARLAKELSEAFRAQYRRAVDLARAGR